MCSWRSSPFPSRSFFPPYHVSRGLLVSFVAHAGAICSVVCFGDVGGTRIATASEDKLVLELF